MAKEDELQQVISEAENIINNVGQDERSDRFTIEIDGVMLGVLKNRFSDLFFIVHTINQEIDDNSNLQMGLILHEEGIYRQTQQKVERTFTLLDNGSDTVAIELSSREVDVFAEAVFSGNSTYYIDPVDLSSDARAIAIQEARLFIGFLDTVEASGGNYDKRHRRAASNAISLFTLYSSFE